MFTLSAQPPHAEPEAAAAEAAGPPTEPRGRARVRRGAGPKLDPSALGSGAHNVEQVRQQLVARQLEVATASQDERAQQNEQERAQRRAANAAYGERCVGQVLCCCSCSSSPSSPSVVPEFVVDLMWCFQQHPYLCNPVVLSSIVHAYMCVLSGMHITQHHPASPSVCFMTHSVHHHRHVRFSVRRNRLRRASVYGKHPGWDMRAVIVKTGDDCRQELLAVQMVQAFADVFAEAGLPLWLRPFEVLVTSNRTALIQVCLCLRHRCCCLVCGLKRGC